MAKVDVSKIEGYVSMTAEEKIAAIEAMDIPDPDYSGYVKKELYDKTASDLSKLKKEHNSKLSEDEKKAQEREEELTALRDELAQIKLRETISTHKSEFLGMGYDDSLADETAKALANGDLKKVFENQRKFLESHDKSIKAELLKGTPTPPAGQTDSGMTKAKFKALSPSERHKYSVENPEDYKKLYENGGNE